MDKFGIFKLLNSFFDFYVANKTVGKDVDVNNRKGNSSDILNSLSSLLTGKNDKGKTEKLSEEPIGKNTQNAPLQNSMLSVMKNHEQTVKRIRDKAGHN